MESENLSNEKWGFDIITIFSFLTKTPNTKDELYDPETYKVCYLAFF